VPCVKGGISLPRIRRMARGRTWYGGDSRTLYAFEVTDELTGRTSVSVFPGGGSRKKLVDRPSPDAAVRVATKAEAEKHWQKPLHAGWKYACPRRR
jgi:hypothetical protein